MVVTGNRRELGRGAREDRQPMRGLPQAAKPWPRSVSGSFGYLPVPHLVGCGSLPIYRVKRCVEKATLQGNLLDSGGLDRLSGQRRAAMEGFRSLRRQALSLRSGTAEWRRVRRDDLLADRP